MSLAEPNEPLILANGMKINPSNGFVIDNEADFVEVPTNKEAIRKITEVNRTISDLPDIPKNMNTISIILTYTLFGLSEMNIGIATGLTSEQIANIKMSDAYAKFNDEIVTNLVTQEASNVRNIFSEHSHKAAMKIVNLVSSDNTGIALSASKDLLDRAGHRPVDIVEHKLTLDDSLEIIHVIKDETKTNELPVIDIIQED